MTRSAHDILAAFGLDRLEGTLAVHSPINGAAIAHVAETPASEMPAMIARAQTAFRAWRNVPAPRRGELVRLLGEELRAAKDDLGALVTLEAGKIVSEGLGEVQEMIDICDFAVGLSRQLYGLTMHSERPGHRMYEQYHPLGIVGIISAFNFPVAVWSWNAFLAAVCGDICIWKPSPKTPLTAIASMKICNDVLREAGFPDIFFLFNDAGTELAQKFVDDKRIALISVRSQNGTRVPRQPGWFSPVGHRQNDKEYDRRRVQDKARSKCGHDAHNANPHDFRLQTFRRFISP